MLTDAAGEPTAKFTYDAYGGLEASTGSQTTPFGYAGQYTLAQSELQYLRARVYDPVTGQFLTRDPIEELTREPYAYVYDNPLNGTDPSGRFGGAAAGCVIGEAIEPLGGCVPGAAAGAAATVAAGVVGWLLSEATDDEDSGLSEAEREYEEKHHECPLERNPAQDKKVTERELEEARLDAHDLKEGRKGTDIYKDREGNLYEKRQGGKGPGEPLGIKIKDRF